MLEELTNEDGGTSEQSADEDCCKAVFGRIFLFGYGEPKWGTMSQQKCVFLSQLIFEGINFIYLSYPVLSRRIRPYPIPVYPIDLSYRSYCSCGVPPRHIG